MNFYVQYSGPSRDALAYVEWLRGDERFSDILVQISAAQNGHAFPKLKLRYKPSLVQASSNRLLLLLLFLLHLVLSNPFHSLLNFFFFSFLTFE